MLSLNWWETQQLAATGLDHVVPDLLGDRELNGEARILFGATGFARTFQPLSLGATTPVVFTGSATATTERPAPAIELAEPIVVRSAFSVATVQFSGVASIVSERPRAIGAEHTLRVRTFAAGSTHPPITVDATFRLETFTEADVSAFLPVLEPVLEVEPEAFDSDDIILIAALWMQSTRA